jgi:hypothetical protein
MLLFRNTEHWNAHWSHCLLLPWVHRSVDRVLSRWLLRRRDRDLDHIPLKTVSHSPTAGRDLIRVEPALIDIASTLGK